MTYALWLPDVIRSTGLNVRVYKGWESRGGSSFNPVGYMWHHTVTKPSLSDVTLDVILAERGNSVTPPPLCNISTKRDGSITVIAAGVANHGGKGSWRGRSGNRFFVGDEMANYGTQDREPWSQIQLESARVAAAAIASYLGMDPQMFCGHKEYGNNPPGWPGRKTDPHTLSMEREREMLTLNMEGVSDVWAWNDGKGAPIESIEDADAVFGFQGGIFAGTGVATYLMKANDQEFRRGVLLGHARTVEELMKQGDRLRNGGL